MELDARGRRLSAALAAVLVRDNALELRLKNWSDLYRHYAIGRARPLAKLDAVLVKAGAL